MYNKVYMVAYLKYKKNDKTNVGLALFKHQGLVLKGLFSRCANVWLVILDKFQDDYIEVVEDDMLTSQQQDLYGAHFNTNKNQISPSHLLHH